MGITWNWAWAKLQHNSMEEWVGTYSFFSHIWVPTYLRERETYNVYKLQMDFSVALYIVWDPQSPLERNLKLIVFTASKNKTSHVAMVCGKYILAIVLFLQFWYIFVRKLLYISHLQAWFLLSPLINEWVE